MPRLTKRMLDRLQPAPKDQFVWDSEIRGLGVRLKPSGTKTFFIQYRNESRRTRRFVIGQYGLLTVEQARSLAQQRLTDVIKGEDPSAERKALLRACSVQDVCHWYLKEAESGRLLGRRGKPIKSSTLVMDRSRIQTHILPLLGSRIVSSLMRRDIEHMQADIVAGKSAKKRVGRGGNTTGGSGAASSSVSTLHSAFEHAVRMNLIGSNPARGVRKIAGQRRERRLSESEIIQVGRTMEAMLQNGESRTGLLVVEFILLTGFRRMEALTFERSWLDPSLKCIHFPDTKSGRQTRVIGSAAGKLIKSIRKPDTSVFVFPADFGEGHFVGAPRVLERVMKFSGLSGVTLHTLRHTFASIGGELGFSELTLAGLLGHSARGVTQRYIHLDEALVVAADRISERIAMLIETGRRDTNRRRTRNRLAQDKKQSICAA